MLRNVRKYILSFCSLLLLSSIFLWTPPETHAADSWYNTSWLYRKKLIIDNSAQAENLTDFPVLVKLNSSRFDFALAQSAGQDIRFTDSNGTTLLSYEIESYDSSSSSANIWVKVPQIDASSSTDYIYVYYGNSSAADAQSPTSVWDSNSNLVYHFKEQSGTYADATTAVAHIGTITGTSSQVVRDATGIAGYGVKFLQTTGGDYINIPKNSAISYTGNFTMSIWVNKAGMADDGGWLIGDWWWPSNAYNSYAIWPMCTATYYGWYTSGTWPPNQTLSGAITGSSLCTGWHHLVLTRVSNTANLYVDGVLFESTTGGSGNTANVDNSLRIGRVNSLDGAKWLVDEVRLSNTNRSASWIAADYKSGNDTLISSFDTPTAASSDFTLTDIMTTSIQIQWQTTHTGTTQIEYGTTSSYGSTTSAISVTEGTTSTNSKTLQSLLRCTLYHFRMKNVSSSTGGISYSNDSTLNTKGCPSTTFTSSSNEQVQIAQTSDGNVGGVVTAIHDGTSTQKVLTILEPNTFQFSAFLSATNFSVEDFKKTTSIILKGNSMLISDKVLRIRAGGYTWWQIGEIENITYKDHFNHAVISTALQSKPSILGLSYTDSDLLIAGRPGQKFNEKLLKLAYSADGRTWIILPTSVVDTVNNTVGALHKIGGYYMIVGR